MLYIFVNALKCCGGEYKTTSTCKRRRDSHEAGVSCLIHQVRSTSYFLCLESSDFRNVRRGGSVLKIRGMIEGDQCGNGSAVHGEIEKGGPS
jgi:hypothetical protein